MRTSSLNAADAPQPEGGYAQALELRDAARILFISGQIPETREGAVPAAFRDQALLVWRNIEAQLRAAEMSLDNLIKVTTYLSDRQHAAENSRVRNEVLGSRAVALTVIVAGIYDQRWLIEIEAVAAA